MELGNSFSCHCEPKAWQSHEIASSSLTSFGIPRNDRESHCEQSVAISGEQNSKIKGQK